MGNETSIDLHPEKIPGGAHGAVRACRDFLDRALAAGHRQVRIVTGLGTHGDGTPRLRTRIEQDVLGAYHSHIEQTGYEQGGAVIRLWLKAAKQKQGAAWQRHERHHRERVEVADREERYLVARERLLAADQSFDDGDFRRCRLKLNQVAREFAWEVAEGVLSEETALRLLDAHWERLNALDS